MSTPDVFKAIVIDVDGHRTVMTWTPAMIGSETGMLGLLQAAVGGYIELVQLASDLEMWVNEEGSFGLPVNPYAKWFGSFFNWPVTFYGDVVLTGGDDGQGNTLSLTDEQVQDILDWPWPRVVETANLPGMSGEKNDETKRETE